jgi:hypothetical protein
VVSSHALQAGPENGGALGTPVSGITLFMFGGMAQLAREPSRASAELVVSPATEATRAVHLLGTTESDELPVVEGLELQAQRRRDSRARRGAYATR